MNQRTLKIENKLKRYYSVHGEGMGPGSDSPTESREEAQINFEKKARFAGVSPESIKTYLVCATTKVSAKLAWPEIAERGQYKRGSWWIEELKNPRVIQRVTMEN